MFQRSTAFAFALMTLAAASNAHADAPAPSASTPAETGPAKTDNAAAAQEFFDQALKYMEQRKFSEACSKFEASNKAAWAPGTTINLADCYEQIGRFASAWAKFLESEPHFRNRNPPDPRADVAKERAQALYPKLSRVTIDVPATAKVTGLVITRDGDPVDSTQWGSGVPVDPGKHLVEAKAPGKKTWKWEAEVGAGGTTVTVSVPVLEDAPITETPNESGMPVSHKIAIGVGAIGVIGLAAGGALGGITLGKVGDSNKTCAQGSSGTFVCDKTGAALRDEAASLSIGSTAALIAGGVLVAGGIVLWIVAPGSSPPPKEKAAASAQGASNSSQSARNVGSAAPPVQGAHNVRALPPVQGAHNVRALPPVQGAHNQTAARSLWIAPMIGETPGIAAGGSF